MGSAKDGWFLQRVKRGITRFSDYANSLGPDMNLGRPRALRPNYTRDTVSVYCGLMRFLARQSPRMLDALDHVQHRGDPEEGPYPSWMPRWFEAKSCFIFSGAFLAGFCDGHFRYFAGLHDCLLSGDAVWPRVLSLDGFRFDIVQATSEVMTLGSSNEETASAIRQVWPQLFQAPLFPRTKRSYRDGESLDAAFCKALLTAPLGTIIGSIVMRCAATLGLHLDI